VTINCNTVGNTLSMTDPLPDATVAAAADSLSSTATFTDSSGLKTINGGGSTALNNATMIGTDIHVTVDMEADFNTTYGTNIPGGNYAYTVTLSLTP
jgi:hypothetical protein